MTCTPEPVVTVEAVTADLRSSEIRTAEFTLLSDGCVEMLTTQVDGKPADGEPEFWTRLSSSERREFCPGGTPERSRDYLAELLGIHGWAVA